ncbi:MATH domain and coiled-coil domain-containing protein [Arabidopsis thaliana]
MGGCEWFLGVYAKGFFSDHLYVYFGVSNPESMEPGWKMRASYYVVLLNQSGKELCRTSEACNLFCPEVSNWCFSKTLPLSKLQEKGFLENNKLTIEVYIKVAEVVKSVSWIFVKHPDTAVHFLPKNKLVKKAHMNTLLCLIKTLRKPPLSLSETELSNAYSELTKLTEVGFKLDWLKSKLEKASLERKKSVSDGSQVQQLKEQVKNLELTVWDLKVELEKEKIVADKISAYDSRIKQISKYFVCFLLPRRTTKTLKSKQMGTQFRKALTLTVTNFSQKSSPINSPPFPSGGCNWYIKFYPKGSADDNYLSLFLSPDDPKSLGLNWKRRANFYFVLLNQSGKELHRTPEIGDQWFCDDSLSWGFPQTLPRKKLLDKIFLDNDRFNIEIYIKVIEVVEGYHMFPASFTNKLLRSSLEYPDKSEKETVDINGFKVLSSQVTSVKRIFEEHPDIAEDFRSKNQVVKTEYMSVLLRVIETMAKPPQSISETELSNVHSELTELTEVGFKVEWLKAKLEEVCVAFKKANADGCRIQQLEEHVKNLEQTVSDLKVEMDKEKAKSTAKVLSLEDTLSDLKTELGKEKAKNATATDKFLLLKDTYSDLKVELEKEKAKSTSAAAKVLSLKEALSDLKVELDDQKIVNSATTANVLSWEDDDDLFSHTNCLGIQQKTNAYKRIN